MDAVDDGVVARTRFVGEDEASRLVGAGSLDEDAVADDDGLVGAAADDAGGGR